MQRPQQTTPSPMLSVRFRTVYGVLVLSSECCRRHAEGARDDDRQRGSHPPSALIAITSAVPSVTIMSPTLQLP